YQATRGVDQISGFVGGRARDHPWAGSDGRKYHCRGAKIAPGRNVSSSTIPTASIKAVAGAPGGRREQMGAAFFFLAAFYWVYCARPEDWFHPLAIIPLAKLS